MADAAQGAIDRLVELHGGAPTFITADPGYSVTYQYPDGAIFEIDVESGAVKSKGNAPGRQPQGPSSTQRGAASTTVPFRPSATDKAGLTKFISDTEAVVASPSATVEEKATARSERNWAAAELDKLTKAGDKPTGKPGTYEYDQYGNPIGVWNADGTLDKNLTAAQIKAAQRGAQQQIGKQYSPYDDVFRKYAGEYAGDDEFIRIVAAGTKAESNWDTNNRTGDGGKSWGLFQMHENGAGAGMGAARNDPDAASAVMVPRYAAAYAQARRDHPELQGAQLAAYVAAQAERPLGYDDPNSAARRHYAEAYSGLTGNATPAEPGKPVNTDKGDRFIVTQNADGSYSTVANPNYQPSAVSTGPKQINSDASDQFLIFQNPDGSITSRPNPNYAGPKSKDPQIFNTAAGLVSVTPGADGAAPTVTMVWQKPDENDVFHQAIQRYHAAVQQIDGLVASGEMTPQEGEKYKANLQQIVTTASQGLTPSEAATNEVARGNLAVNQQNAENTRLRDEQTKRKDYAQPLIDASTRAETFLSDAAKGGTFVKGTGSLIFDPRATALMVLNQGLQQGTVDPQFAPPGHQMPQQMAPPAPPMNPNVPPAPGQSPIATSRGLVAPASLPSVPESLVQPPPPAPSLYTQDELGAANTVGVSPEEYRRWLAQQG